jgi:hypothetical protein
MLRKQNAGSRQSEKPGAAQYWRTIKQEQLTDRRSCLLSTHHLFSSQSAASRMSA